MTVTARPRRGGGLVADDDLADAISRLPAKQKQAVAYHYLAGLPYADIAVILGGTAEAARRAAADGIARLRRSYPAAAGQASPGRASPASAGQPARSPPGQPASGQPAAARTSSKGASR